ncbi:hypothetical protein CYMTET_51021 [Cymbomonas tetramitiformis]|uniref:Uncharacterized protein n=1 Tax=Cymbomonas tetramitiformis TaxID=36881 RepID=A0AAE0BNI3_9CHLO|nr:hypothetical protein CYMTET_51021 [Cymbomonas tetramitiformis]
MHIIFMLDPIDSIKTAMIFDLELAHATKNYDINSIVFTMLSVLLRGAALDDVYLSLHRQTTHAFDGRTLLLRLHFIEVEGVQRGDMGRFMESIRALRLDEPRA